MRQLRSALRLVLFAGVVMVRVTALAASESTGGGEAKPKVDFAVSGEARFRPEWRDNLDFDSSVGDDLRQGFMRLRLGLTLGIGEDLKLFIQAQDSRVAGEEASSSSNEKNLDLHQGYVSLRATESLSLILGRQELKYGEERLIGDFGWNNVGRSFDAVKGRFARGRFWLDGVVARVTSRTVNGASEGSDLAMVYTQTAIRKGSEYEGYLLFYNENVPIPGEAGLDGDTAIQAVGARIKDRFGRFDGVLEAVLERGSFHGDDLCAHAFAGQAGLTWGEQWKTRTFAGYDFATGDEDSTDGRREEFFNFFPTNHSHYGYADLQGWRNMRGPWGGVSLSHGRHFAQAKLNRFLLEEEAGPWKDDVGTVLGFDPAGASGNNVGQEVDLTYRFAWKEKIALEGGASRFVPGSFARRTRGDDPTHWAYLQMNVRF